MERYIEKYITTPLNEALQKENIWINSDFKEELVDSMDQCRLWGGMEKLNRAMQPFYERYFFAHPSILGNEKYEVREVIGRAIGLDTGYFNGQECESLLFKSADCWAEYLKNQGYSHSTGEYFSLMERVSENFYLFPSPVNLDTMRSKLVREKVAGNSYSREVYCIMYSFIAIWEKDYLSFEQKRRLFELLKYHWHFIRAIYSAMLQRVVGYGYQELSAIAHCVKSDVPHHRYIHLFYSALMEHKEKIIASGTKRNNLDNALNVIREIVAKTKPSNELDELCAILFSNKLKQYLDKHHPKYYHELEGELQRITAQVRTLAEQLSTMISVDVIAQKLLDLPPQTARAVFLELNAMLMGNEAWVKIQTGLYNRILERTREPGMKIEHADQVIAVAENNANVIHTKY